MINADPRSLEPDSVWIYRFYDAASDTFGVEPQSYDIGRAARGLVDFIDLVQAKTRGGPPVYLVAHSMGGLICRTVLQRELADPAEAVSKLCTIGTPHGGISAELGGPIGSWLMDRFRPLGSNIFSPGTCRSTCCRPPTTLPGKPTRKRAGGTPGAWWAPSLPPASSASSARIHGTIPWPPGCRPRSWACRAMVSSRSATRTCTGVRGPTSIAPTRVDTAWSTPRKRTRTFPASCPAGCGWRSPCTGWSSIAGTASGRARRGWPSVACPCLFMSRRPIIIARSI
ncbi:hypothetical protein E3T40_15350 [Cryobacterium sp. TMT1-19]|nr:hypothetical protein E3T40_15350 [Cryobacterium sp. TMT1-19]